MQILIIVVILFLIIKFIKKENENINIDQNDTEKISKNKLKKVLYGLLLFFPLYIIYYFLIAAITGLVVWGLAGAADGSWGYAILFGIYGSPIFTIITIIKILNKK